MRADATRFADRHGHDRSRCFRDGVLLAVTYTRTAAAGEPENFWTAGSQTIAVRNSETARTAASTSVRADPSKLSRSARATTVARIQTPIGIALAVPKARRAH